MKTRRSAIITVSAIVLAAALIVSAYAILSGKSEKVTNRAGSDSDRDPVISETFDGNEKSNVVIGAGNVDYSVYIRAVAVATWKDAEGNVLGTVPREGTDYEIQYGDGWLYENESGFRYWPSPVGKNETTGPFIVTCTDKGNAPDGYSLHVEIVSQTVQAIGRTDDGTEYAVEDAWGVPVVNGKLAPDNTSSPNPWEVGFITP